MPVEDAASNCVARPTRSWTLSCLWVGAILSSAPPVVQASPPEYLGHRGPWVESAEHANTPIDDLGQPSIRRGPEPGATDWSWLTDAELKLQIRSYYLERDREGEADSLAWALGGSVAYRSGLWRDRVGLGATFYTSQPLDAPADKPGSGLLAPVQRGYSVLGESYLLARPFGTSYLQIWRQGLQLPYINENDVRMTPRTFEAYVLFDQDNKRFNYILGHVNKMKNRTETTWRAMSDAAGAAGSNRGVSVLGALFKLGERARVGAVNEYGYDTFNTFYIESNGSGDLGGEHRLQLHGAFQYTNQASVGQALIGSFNTWQVGAKVDIGSEQQKLTLAYSDTGAGAGIQTPWGGTPSYNSVIVEDFDRAAERAWRIGAAFDLSRFGLDSISGFVNYVAGDTPDSGRNASSDQDELDFTLDWKPKGGRLRGLWLRARVASINAAGTGAVDQMDYRLILNYDFSPRW